VLSVAGLRVTFGESAVRISLEYLPREKRTTEGATVSDVWILSVALKKGASDFEMRVEL
jgi:hypothetical protein